MTKSKVILAAAALSLPFATLSLPAVAATAHNTQTDASSSNANNTMASGHMMKKMKMKKKHMKKM